MRESQGKAYNPGMGDNGKTNKGGRPSREVPPEVGAYSDADAAYLIAQRGGTPTTPEGVRYLRRTRGIPAWGQGVSFPLRVPGDSESR